MSARPRMVKPVHGVFLVLAFIAAVLLLNSRAGSSPHSRVSPGPDGTVHIDLAGLGREQVRFYRFLNAANQEVDFFVGRDAAGVPQVAFDASENHYKLRRGFRFENGWIVDNKCGSAIRLSAVNGGGGGCSPIPLRHRAERGEVVIAADDLLRGWRLFR